jgi:hypothetical protein
MLKPFAPEIAYALRPLISLYPVAADDSREPELILNGFVRGCSWCRKYYDRVLNVWRKASEEELIYISQTHRVTHTICESCYANNR